VGCTCEEGLALEMQNDFDLTRRVDVFMSGKVNDFFIEVLCCGVRENIEVC